MKICPQCQRIYAANLRVCQEDGTALVLKDMYGLTGRVIADKYQIGPLAALGGMSAVYRAHQIKVNRPVAFKILLPQLAINHPRMLDRFEQEAHLAGMLSHEHIATVHDAGQTEDHFAYIVMEWLDGHLLETELRQKHYLSFDRIALLLRQIAAALDAAHAARIIHRDLKPSNIMIVTRGDRAAWVKVFDFGMAKVLSDSMDFQISHALGTPHYASPEQFRPGEEISNQSDIYSLGVVLFRMLTRRVPFDAANVPELIKLHLLEVPPPMTHWRPDIPSEVERLVFRMLAKTPHYRPATAIEAADLFEQALASLSPAERQRIVPVHADAEKPAVRTSQTAPLTQAALAAATTPPRAAGFTEVRNTKNLKPLPNTMPALAALAATSTVQSGAPSNETVHATEVKSAPAATNVTSAPTRHDTRTLVLAGLAALLLAALVGYWLFQPHRTALNIPPSSFESRLS